MKAICGKEYAIIMLDRAEEDICWRHLCHASLEKLAKETTIGPHTKATLIPS
jgi:hypothetical protein